VKQCLNCKTQVPDDQKGCPKCGHMVVAIPGTPSGISDRVAAQGRADVQVNGQTALDEFGAANPVLICPHCQSKGLVRTKQVKRKQGISGAKATGAVLTGGLSVIGTGLSKKELVTQAHCDNCGSTWHYS
jgi:DNA-directed RNA polymerase subunit RPC12/RpoP